MSGAHQRPGADAGWRVLFASQRPRPRATQAERWPQHMRPLISTILLTALLAVGCGRSSSSVDTDTVGGQQIVKDLSTNNGVILTRTAIASGPDPAAEYDSIHDGEKAQATFSGGDGSTIKDAVVITASTEEAGNRAAYIWLHEHYPGSRLQEEGSDYDDSARYYSEIKIVTSDGKSRTVFFETTSFWGNGK
jgi:hypothetical protein